MNYPHEIICNQHLLTKIKANLSEFEVRSHSAHDTRHAAVAITIVNIADDTGVYGMDLDQVESDQAALVLTRRASKLKNHAGQWAFPGGKIDPGETPMQTALRELNEEVGLELTKDQFIGFLDDFTTRSGFTITPVVLWAGTVKKLTPNPAEVESIHRIPISEFMRQDAPILEKTPNSQHPVLLMPVGFAWIAAPTAAMIYQFREVAILGKHTRVAHYEQPSFAWK